jgi:integrase
VRPKLNGPPAVRSLPIDMWPEADRLTWAAACRPAERLRRGGGASHMRDVTRRDLARRFGYFLDHAQRTEGELDARAVDLVTPDRVERYIAELKGRVGSITLHGSIYKLRRMAQILAPVRDYTWLADIEKDLALVMEPKSKLDRLVYPNVTAEAGMTLMAEAAAAMHRTELARARQFRDGLMVALLAFHPIRLKNFAALEIGRSFVQVKNRWWIVLSASQTKEGRADERALDDALVPWIDRYLSIHRPVLARGDDASPALWLSSNGGAALTYLAVEKVISMTTSRTIGIDISPHLFRAAAVSSCAVWAGDQPHLGSALLHHTDPAMAQEHYNLATSLSANQSFASLIKNLRRDQWFLGILIPPFPGSNPGTPASHSRLSRECSGTARKGDISGG